MRRKAMMVLTIVMMSISFVACSGEEAGKEIPATETVEQSKTEVDITEEVPEVNSQQQEDSSAGEITADTGSVTILNDIWNAYAEEERFFAMGGDMTNPVDNAAGAFSLEDMEALGATLYVPADSVSMISEAASLIHSMNANTFTGAVFHLSDVENKETFANSLKDNIMGTQWMCGFPDELVIYSIKDEYILSAFGNAEIMTTFKEKVSNVYGGDAEILVEENITQ